MYDCSIAKRLGERAADVILDLAALQVLATNLDLIIFTLDKYH